MMLLPDAFFDALGRLTLSVTLTPFCWRFRCAQFAFCDAHVYLCVNIGLGPVHFMTMSLRPHCGAQRAL